MIAYSAAAVSTFANALSRSKVLQLLGAHGLCLKLNLMNAISAIDGRYQGKTKALRCHLQRIRTMKFRTKVEAAGWLSET